MARSRGPDGISLQLQSKQPAILPLLAGAVSGGALSLSYTGWYLDFFAWVSLALLLVVVFRSRGPIAAACGVLHGFVFVLVSIPWFATVLEVHGDLPRPVAIAVLLLIAAAWGVLTGAFAWCVHRAASRSVASACFAAPFLWVAMEFARAHLPEIGFPWNLLGYPASANLALVQLTAITGIYSLSFLVAAFNALIAWTISSPSPRPARRLGYSLFVAAALLLVIAVGPRFVPEQPPAHFARVLQPNLPELKAYPPDWFQANASDLEEMVRLSLAASNRNPDLLVWPEAPAPFSFQDARFARPASDLAIRFGHPFLAGVVEWKLVAANGTAAAPPRLAPFNSAILVDAQGQRVFSYDKMHLVPFGEYEPFPLIHRVVRSLSSEVGGFHPGSTVAVGRLPSGYRFGVFICYESIFPGEIRRFAANGAQLLINISNDGWFGRSAAPEQHLRMARVRAVENRRWLLRVTNNGFSASVDPYGRIVARIPADIRQAADLPYDFRTETTLYTRFGDWFVWLCVFISAILLVVGVPSRRRSSVPAGKET